MSLNNVIRTGHGTTDVFKIGKGIFQGPLSTKIEREEELKNLLLKVKEDSEKAGLKLSIQKSKTMASGPISSVQSLSHVQLFVTPWNAASQSTLSMANS